MRRNVDLLCAPFTMTRQNLTRESEVGKQSDFFFRWSDGTGFVSLSMPFNQHCGAIYVRSKSYLVFKISSDIMTKHCCQVCALSMMFCRSDSRLCWPCWHGKWWRNRETWVPRGLTLRQANAGNYMKNILYVWFSHLTLTETHRWLNYSLSLYFNKNKNSPVLTHLLATSKPSLKIVGLRRGLW